MSSRPHPVLQQPWFILFLIALPYLLSTFLRASPSVMAVELAQEFQITVSQLAPISGLYVLAYGLMQIPSGVLSDVIGARRTICLLLICMALGNFGFAMAESLGLASIARGVAGGGAALVVPCLVILARTFKGREYTRASAVLLFLGNTGVAIAAAPLVLLISLLGWRALMCSVGVICLVFSLAFSLVIPNDLPERSGPQAHTTLTRIRTVFTTRGFWPLAFVYTCITGMFFSFTSFWWGPLLIQGCGFSQQTAGNMIFIGSLPLLAGIPGIVLLADVLRSHRKALQSLLVVACLVTLLQGLFIGKLPAWMMTVLGGSFVLCCGTGAVVFSATRSLVSDEVVGTATGCMNAFPCLVTGLFQSLFGWVLEAALASGNDIATAYGRALFVNAAILSAALACALFLMRETYPKN